MLADIRGVVINPFISSIGSSILLLVQYVLKLGIFLSENCFPMQDLHDSSVDNEATNGASLLASPETVPPEKEGYYYPAGLD